MDSDREGSAGRRQEVAHVVRQAHHEREQVSAVTGVVMESLPSALYKVRLDEGSLVMAHIADRMDRNFVRILVGDRVRLELSPSDAGRGRIVERL
jgi:translation initiation factor IF-1